MNEVFVIRNLATGLYLSVTGDWKAYSKHTMTSRHKEAASNIVKLLPSGNYFIEPTYT